MCESVPETKRSRWTVLRIAVVGSLAVCAGGAALWLTDRRLEPWEDLKPVALPPLATGVANGREYLRGRWAVLGPANHYQNSEILYDVIAGRMAWDAANSDMSAAAARGADRLVELQDALAMPGWRGNDPERVSDYKDEHLNFKHACFELTALTFREMHAGRKAEAAGVMMAMAEAGRREIHCATFSTGLGAGQRLSGLFPRILPSFLMLATAEDDALCQQLQDACVADWMSAPVFRGCLLRQVESRCHDLLTLSGEDRVPWVEGQRMRDRRYGEGRRSWMLKSQATVNIFHTALREALPLLLAPARTREDSIDGVYRRWQQSKIQRFLPTSNREGRAYVEDEVSAWYWRDQIWRRELFLQRAAVVRIALHRFEMAHGHRPATLVVLCPDFLAGIPADPWDGKPLRYAAAGDGLLYGLGSDWTDNPGAAFWSGRAGSPRPEWVGEDLECPAMRLRLPPP